MAVDALGRETAAAPKRRVAGFFDWWLGELAGMLPGGLRRAARLERDVFRLELSGEVLEITVGSGRRLRSIATVPLAAADPAYADHALAAALDRIDLERYRVVLVLDDAKALRRTLTLPRAAAAELADLLEFEIERHTPFRADQVYFYYAVAAAADDDTVAVTLVVIPRRIVDPLMQRLAGHGLVPDAVTLSDPALSPGTAARRLSAPARNGGEARGRRRLKLMLGLAVALAAAAALSPVLRLSLTANRLAADVARAAEDADATRALQREADRLSQGVEAVARAKASAPSPLRILNTLSTLLPDDTWLAQLGVTGDEVTLEGRTASSATLVGLLESSEMFDQLTYLSPVTRDGGGAFERFNFSVKLSGR